MFLGDFHIHSNFSDGKLSIPELVDLYGRLGFGAIAITDHLCEGETLLGWAAKHLNRTLTREIFPHYIKLLESEARRAWRLYRMVVIPGVEITKNSLSNHRSAHVLGLGVRQFVSADTEVLQSVKDLRAQGALTIAAHPVSTRKLEKQTYHLWNQREELSPLFDAWEVASGQVLFDEVAKSGLPLIASSDLHAPWQVHSWKTALSCERHPEAILDAIRRQELDFQYFEEPLPWDLRYLFSRKTSEASRL